MVDFKQPLESGSFRPFIWALILPFVGLNICFPFFASSLVSVLGISQTKTGFFIGLHELVLSSTASILLFALYRLEQGPSRSWIRHLAIAFAPLAVADFAYGVDYYLLGSPFPGTQFIMIHEIPYALAVGALGYAAMSRATDATQSRDLRIILFTSALIAVFTFVCSYQMILSFQFPAGIHRPWTYVVTSYAYAFFQSLAVGGFFVASLRSASLTEFFIWLFLLSIFGSDFALRYQDVGQRPLGTPVFEYGWELSLVGIASLLAATRRQVSRATTQIFGSPYPIASFRVLLPVASFTVFGIFVATNLFLAPYFEIVSVNTFSGHALLIISIWCGANVAGILFSRKLVIRISDLSRAIESAKTLDDFSSLRRTLTELDPIISALHSVNRKLRASMEENAQLQAQAAIGEIASQVSHDIRSPLAALDMALSDLPALTEERRTLVRNAVGRIKDIANNLLSRNRSFSKSDTAAAPNMQMSQQLVSSLIESIASEKRFQYGNNPEIQIALEIDRVALSAFAEIQPTDFKRLVSNLINNAIEAVEKSGHVKIFTEVSDGKIRISIQDNGKGIPPNILSRLGRRGETHGKAGGSGLGLFHARKSVESWKGSLNIESQEEVGTKVNILLPIAQPPPWYAEEVKFFPVSTIVIMDDDSSVHAMWRQRFANTCTAPDEVRIIHLSNPDEVLTFCRTQGPSERILFLLDYEILGHDKTGLDLIEELKISHSSVLVTSRWEDISIQERCGKSDIRILPKYLAGFVPLILKRPEHHPDAVLLDDDALVIMTWKSVAAKNQKQLLTFSEPREFFETLKNLSRSTPIYVDSELSNGIKGQDLVPKIRALGFTAIFITSGHHSSKFSEIEGLAGIHGKDPPPTIGGPIPSQSDSE